MPPVVKDERKSGTHGLFKTTALATVVATLTNVFFWSKKKKPA